MPFGTAIARAAQAIITFIYHDERSVDSITLRPSLPSHYLSSCHWAIANAPILKNLKIDEKNKLKMAL
ncbi:hypothetical protein [Nostoc sp. ATCC 53789]|uniref:hypothetical protein n=1 Tax=Nostoc sp. ATCC 53789 TaxID=76335 RepID=UPI0011BDFC82|nr:hypothetical protein [Nostoc sp. ATCC 53789]QHG20406.1 hypothetical protein GJB62_31325 [Nostoc sp. ATCC 53789]